MEKGRTQNAEAQAPEDARAVGAQNLPSSSSILVSPRSAEEWASALHLELSRFPPQSQAGWSYYNVEQRCHALLRDAEAALATLTARSAEAQLAEVYAALGISADTHTFDYVRAMCRTIAGKPLHELESARSARRERPDPVRGYWTEMLSILGGDESDLGPQLARDRMKALGEAQARVSELQGQYNNVLQRLRDVAGGIVTEHKQWNGSWFCHPGCTYWHDGYHVEACHFLAARKKIGEPSSAVATGDEASSSGPPR